MSWYIIEDSELAKRNRSLVLGCGGELSYNAVLSVSSVDIAPGTEPITPQEAKDWCRVDIDDDDTLITMLITAARIVCENHANLSFIPKTITARIINGLGNFTLPYGPVNKITTVTDVDDEDITSSYDLFDSYSGAVTIVYDAGYSTLPQNLKTAVLNQIAWMYENRGSEMRHSGVSQLSKLLLDQYRYV